MANFIFPSYSEQESEEFDSKVLLIPKEKYTQQMIKFSEYNPAFDTYKFICSISYNDSKVYRVIYDNIEDVKLFDKPTVFFWYSMLIKYFLDTAKIGSNETQNNLRYFFNICARKDRTAEKFLKMNWHPDLGVFLRKGYLAEIAYYLSKKDLSNLDSDFKVQTLLDKFFYVFRKFAEDKSIEIESKDKIGVKLGAAALETILVYSNH